ncbi:MAG TPA: Asp-tRNA(Asn)/Glu-tRNA(Gln) amidotransferase subunit GatB [Anaerolineae bacterium]|nr:Asp-tRNA(Asn)/Glu-tRNA(Gln) amidotransferase subunit GatB [Anaerolineae bacterium]
MEAFETVIGLETHVQLNTLSKIFCACKADSWGDPANSNICPICTGLPGVLPTLNRAVVEKAVLLAAALQADAIQDLSYLARKNYFYPDLPKGYQISQYNEPLARGGCLELPLPDGSVRVVGIEKLHIEEDAGKTIRQGDRRLIDFNRCGVPLAEVVTKPDLRSADEVAQYLIRLRQIVRWIGVSEGNMEKGQMRCDANISIRALGSEELNTKTEIKNLNSIDAARMAVQAEIERQVEEVREGGAIHPWTLNWDDENNTLFKMRAKETEADYRYFREPDLLPIRLVSSWRGAILEELPELPLERRARFIEAYRLPEYDAEILTEERSFSDYFEDALAEYGGEAKTVSNWLMNDVLRLIRERDVLAAELRLRPEHLAEIIHLLDDKKITTNIAKELLDKVQESGKAPSSIVEEEGLSQVSDQAALRKMAEQVLADNPDQVATYRGGKTTVIGWFVGQIMKQSKGKANPQMVREILEELLAN